MNIETSVLNRRGMDGTHGALLCRLFDVSLGIEATVKLYVHIPSNGTRREYNALMKRRPCELSKEPRPRPELVGEFTLPSFPNFPSSRDHPPPLPCLRMPRSVPICVILFFVSHFIVLFRVAAMFRFVMLCAVPCRRVFRFALPCSFRFASPCSVSRLLCPVSRRCALFRVTVFPVSRCLVMLRPAVFRFVSPLHSVSRCLVPFRVGLFQGWWWRGRTWCS